MSTSPRALWKGLLAVGSFSLPVRLLSASEPDAAVSFNQAHRCGTKKTALTRIKQKKWCPTCQKEVAHGDIARIYEHAKGQYLEVTDAELEACEDPTSSTLSVTAIIDEPLTPLFIETTTYLVGDGPGAAAALEPLRVALGTRMAIGTVVIHKRTVRVALQATSPSGFVAYVLRSRDQVRQLEAPDLVMAAAPRAQVQAAKDLLGSLHGRFAYEGIEDAYATRVRAMLAKKIAQQNAGVTDRLARATRAKTRKSA